ncbi:MAG: hypothetical protein NT013_17340 [Planctomycetia bacterium]|nr:hypothetical protein [Planctomycetia bacterium]
MSSDTSAWLPSELADHLREVKSWVRWQWLLRGFGRVVLVLSVSLAAVFLLDFRMDLNPTARLAALCSIGTLTGVALLSWLAVPLCRRIGWAELAAMADKAHPEWEDSLTSAVELFDPSQPDSFKGSPVMRQMLLEQTRQRVEELDLERVVSSRRAWRSVKLGLAACLLLAAPVFFAPSVYRQLWQRLLMPSGNWGTVGAWQIEVADGDRVVARGADIELLAKATKPGIAEPPKSLLLEWRDSVGTTDRRSMPYDAARQAFATIVPHVMRDLKFHVSVDRQQSRDYQVQVVEPPVITQVRVDVEPPAYAGWPAQSLDGAVGAIRVFERSRLKFKLEFNKPIETASLNWRHGGEPLTFELAADKQSASMELVADPKVHGPYAFAIADIHKLTNSDIVPRELVVVADEPPHLIVKGDQSTEVRPDDAVPIDVIATDDIGLGQLELHFEVNKGESQKLIAEKVQGQKEVEHRFTLDLSSLKVEQGQWLTYKIRTTDERPDPEPHEVWSDVRVLRISTKAPPPGFNEVAKTQEELRQELKQLQTDIVQRQRDLEAQRKQSEIAARTKKEPLAPERLQQIEEQIAELKQRGEKLADQLSADPLFHELGEQVRDVAEQQLPAAEQEVKQAQQDTGREQIDELRRGEQQLAEAAKKLQQVEKPFQQLAELQKDLLELNRLARQAEQLANRADELNREQAANEPKPADAQNADPQEKANEQAANAEQAQKNDVDEKQLAKDQSKLADALNDLLKRRPELLNAAKRDELDRLAQLAEQAKELAEQQRELADAIREQQAAAAERNAALAEKQQDLQKRAEAATEKAAAAKPAGDEPKADKPATPEALQEAVAAIEQGDLAEAQKQQQQAANELDRLATELQQAKANQSPLAQAARELANEQKKLADKAAEAQKSDDPEQRQQAAEQLNRDQAALNKRIEKLPQEKNRKADADDEDKRPALWVELFDEGKKRPLDVIEYAKTLGLDEPLFRGYVLEDWATGLWRISTRESRAIPPLPRDLVPIRQKIIQVTMPGPGILHAMPLCGDCRLDDGNTSALEGRVTSMLSHNVGLPADAEVAYTAYSARPDLDEKLPFPRAMLNGNLEPNDVEFYTRLPEGELKELRLFARDVFAKDENAATQVEIAKRLIAKLKTFNYDKNPDKQHYPRIDTIEDFLRDKKGDCKQFNSALALMLREFKIPSRMILGFKGGKVEDGRFVARWPGHAWVEVYLDGDGDGRGEWLILDATAGSGANGRQQQLAGENPKQNPQQQADANGARQEAQQRGEQAEQALAEGNLEKAAQEQRGAEQALRDLAKQAAQPMPEAQANRGNDAPMPNGDAPQDNAKPNDANRDPAAQQLAQLAKEQRQLAQEVEQARNEQRGEQSQPNATQPPAVNEQANAKNSNEQPMPTNGQQPAGENAQPNQPQPANAQQPNAAQPQSNAGQNPQAQQPGQNQQPQLAQQAQDARVDQRELAQQAQELQKQVQQELGRESAEAKQAQAASEQAQASQRQANSGQFDKAADSGEQAGKSGEKLAKQLQNNARANPELAQQAANLAEQQQAVAQQMEHLAQQPGAKNAAQQQRQQELNNAVRELGQQLAESQNRLGQQPLNLPQQAEGAKQAGQQAANSQQKMEAAKQAVQQGNANQAAQAAEQAAENLKQAAQQAQATSEHNRPPQSPIPRSVSEEVAKAAERLDQLAQAQAEAKQPTQPSALGKDQQEQGQSPSGQGQSGQGQSNEASKVNSKGKGREEGHAPGQGEPSSEPDQTAEERPWGQTARQLRDIARALKHAAKQSAPQPSQGGLPQPGQPSNDPNGNPQLADAGGNGQGSVEQDRGENLSDLPIQVKKVTGRNWGQLSSKLQTELTQAAKHQAHGDYSKLIKLYFQEIAKTQGSAAREKKP